MDQHTTWNEAKPKVEAVLRAAGIYLSFGGCGCCGSPWVSLMIDGEMVLDMADDLSMDMVSEIVEDHNFGMSHD